MLPGEDGVVSTGGCASGFLKKATFVTAPMWVTVALLLSADIRPEPMLPGEGGSGGFHGSRAPPGGWGGVNESEKVRWLEAELRKAQAEAKESAERERALEAALGGKGDLLEAAFDALPCQHLVAFTTGIMGALSIAGPSTFVRFFLSFVGSLVGGLFVAAFAGFTAGGSPFWMDSINALLSGSGSIVAYLSWLVLFSLGMLRWFTGWECGIYAYVDEVEVDDSGNITVLQHPLLPQQRQDESQPPLPPPPGPPPAASSSAGAGVGAV